jgi:exodeoxyribonuclease X
MGHVITVVDFETTGMEPPAQVVEVGFCDLVNDGAGWMVKEGGGWLCGVDAIPPEVRAVHHISLEEVAGRPVYDPSSLWGLCASRRTSVVAAHNAEFEARFWGEAPVPILCTYKAALRVWPDASSHSNGALRYWLQDHKVISPDHDRCMPPHRAGPDAYVTAHILQALLKHVTAAEMVAWTKEPRLLPTCPIGKERGKKWAEVDGGFLSWMTNQPTMEADLKWLAQRELDRRAAK